MSADVITFSTDKKTDKNESNNEPLNDNDSDSRENNKSSSNLTVLSINDDEEQQENLRNDDKQNNDPVISANTPLVYNKYFWMLAAIPTFTIALGGDPFGQSLLKLGITVGIVLAIIGLDMLRVNIKQFFTKDKETAIKERDDYNKLINKTKEAF